MTGRLSLAKVRNLLVSKATQLGNPGATTASIVDAVMREYPDVVGEVYDRLVRSALGRELSRARARAPGNVEPTQTTLWGNFGVAPQIIVVNESGERINKNLDICTFAEVRDYADSLPVRRNRSDRKATFLTMLDALRAFCPKEDKPLGLVWKAAVVGHGQSSA